MYVAWRPASSDGPLGLSRRGGDWRAPNTVTVVRGRVGESPALRPNEKYAWQYAWQCAAEDQSGTPKC
ncbi:hypothetical protein E2C01_015327 [Portunus trituberculatus]|uniref:Uncharacterized protein n=1 Tax=Portunus trituberculatus TaxID=210409 RepID=A0A5B7DMW1_PORTR|nr:hypothetical protein [Portunus trituberculatus]